MTAALLRAQLYLNHARQPRGISVAQPAARTLPASMRAWVFDRYGGPEVLRLTRRPVPRPRPGEVCVEVEATSLNSADLRLMRAEPSFLRLQNGLLHPVRVNTPGSDVVGRVVAVGEGVARWSPGDRVFGNASNDTYGAFAEYVRMRAESLIAAPSDLPIEKLAALPLAGVTALQALRVAGVGADTRLLVYGAGGGVGLFTVALAATVEARVTAVCGPRSAFAARRAGAVDVVDYTRQNAIRSEGRFDAVVAVNGSRWVWNYGRAIRRGGRGVVVGGSNKQLLSSLFLSSIASALTGRHLRVLTIDDTARSADLALLAECVRRGLFVPVGRVVGLEDVQDAMRSMADGHMHGKTVIRIGES